MLVECFKDIETKYGNKGTGERNQEKNAPNPEFSFSGLDLNMGCPARNVMNT